MGYLLDTNIVSYFLKGQFTPVSQKMQEIDFDQLHVSAVTVGEIAFGLARVPSTARTQAIKSKLVLLLQTVSVLPVTKEVGEQYGSIRAALEQAGTPIGGNDNWLAAHALANDLTLVSNNLKEFQRVPGLKCENWIQA